MVGDFNVLDINWGSLTGTSSSISFCDFVFQHNLTQFVNQPTHIKGNILDLVFTNSDELIHNLHVSSPCHSLFSDHSIISFHLQTAKLVLPSVKPRFVFDFPKANLDGLCEFLLEFDFDSCFTSDDVEGIWSTIKQAIQSKNQILSVSSMVYT